MFDIFGRKRIKEFEERLEKSEERGLKLLEEKATLVVKNIQIEFEKSMVSDEIQGYKDRIMKLEKLLNFVTVNKHAKRRNDVLLASLACGKSTVTPVMEYLKRKGIKDPDGGDYKRSTVQDILKPPATK